MKYQNKWFNSLQIKSVEPTTAIAIAAGLAIGTVITALFFTKRGKVLINKMDKLTENLFVKTIRSNPQANLGNLIEDVREHIRQSAEGLLGPLNKRQDANIIHVADVGTLNWKNSQQIKIHHTSSYPH